jgi:hypothetical protein
MSALKLIRDFKAPKDEATANELRRQLGQFESNISDMGDAIVAGAMAPLEVTERDGRTDLLTVGPGQSLGIVNTVSRVQLAKPRAEDAGKFLVICKGGGSATNTQVLAPAGSKINDSPTFLITTSYMMLLVYCDGINYWAT